MITQRNLSRLTKIAELLYDQSVTMNVGAIRALLAVATHEGRGQVDIQKDTGIPIPSLSRLLLDLGQYKRDRSPGLGLIEWTFDPHELRRKKYTLTPKGRRFMAELGKVMEA